MDKRKFTYGIELELSDIDTTKGPPPRCYFTGDADILNTNGVAADDKLIDWKFGSEVNTEPCDSIDEKVKLVQSVFQHFPEAKVTHRSVTHFHISWDGIKEDLEAHKAILKYTQSGNGQWLLDNYWNYPSLRGKNLHIRTKRFFTFDRQLMPDWRYQYCMAAQTIKDFRESNAKVKDGSVVWPTVRRYMIHHYSPWAGSNSLEFRFFYPTTNIDEIRGGFEFITRYVNEALGDQTPVDQYFHQYNLPKEVPYDEKLELSWLKTNVCHQSRELASANRDKLLNGTLDLYDGVIS